MSIALVDLVKAYRALDAKLDADLEAFEANEQRVKDKLMKNKLSAFMLAYLEKVGASSINTPGGTVTRTKRATASLADREAFRRHVIGTESWDLLDWKANLTATNDFIKEHEGTPPPGVTISNKFTLGCTAPRKKGGAAHAALGAAEENYNDAAE